MVCLPALRLSGTFMMMLPSWLPLRHSKMQLTSIKNIQKSSCINMKNIFLLLCIFILATACKTKEIADLIVFNATIYTVDSAFNMAEAMAIKDGKIIAIGKNNDILDNYTAKDKRDAGGKFIYPGLI